MPSLSTPHKELMSCLLFFKAMKGEKGIAGVSVSEGLGEELSEESFGESQE